MTAKAVKKKVKTTKKIAKKKIKKPKSAKKVVKKVLKKAKKVVSKSNNAPRGQEFFLLNGKKVKNYTELAKILEHLEDHVFRHHVNPDNNDFANWIRDVFKDVELAKKIAGIDDKDKMELVLHRRIVRGK